MLLCGVYVNCGKNTSVCFRGRVRVIARSRGLDNRRPAFVDVSTRMRTTTASTSWLGGRRPRTHDVSAAAAVVPFAISPSSSDDRRFRPGASRRIARGKRPMDGGHRATPDVEYNANIAVMNADDGLVATR